MFLVAAMTLRKKLESKWTLYSTNNMDSSFENSFLNSALFLSRRLFREQAQFRRLYTPFDNDMSMTLDTDMSMPFDAVMSIPFDGSMSMRLNVDTTMPVGVDIPRPVSEMPRPLNETRKSLDFTPPLLPESDEIAVVEPASHSSSDFSTKANESNDKGLTSKRLPAAKAAMIVVLSVGAAFIALVMVQRKLATKNRNTDDESVEVQETGPSTASLLVTA